MKGYVNLPIFNVEFKNCTTGLLHLLLRVSEKLFDCILAKINFTDKDNSANLLTECFR